MSSLYDSLMGKTVADKLSEANYKIRVLESELLKVNAKLEVAVDKNWDLEQNKKVIVHELNLGLEITPQKLSEFRRACENVLRSSMYRQQFTAEFEGMYSLFSSLAILYKGVPGKCSCIEIPPRALLTKPKGSPL